MIDITVKDLKKSYGEKMVLDGFSAVFPAGKTTAIMGPSGCGKSTLLNILMGFEKADGGSIEGMPDRMTAVFQEDRLCESFSAIRNLRLVCGRQHSDEELTLRLTELGLSDGLEGPVSNLSGGMKRRVAIARALLAEGELLLMDEPFKGLDEDTRAVVARVIRERCKDRTVIMVTHDEEDVALMDGILLQMKGKSA